MNIPSKCGNVCADGAPTLTWGLQDADIEEKVMKSTGIVRKIDELGRIVLPIELRRTLDIGERETMEIFVDGPSVVLKKYRPTCIFCDNIRDISVFKGKNVCPKCLREIQEALSVRA